MRKIATASILIGIFFFGLLFLLPALISTDWVRNELGRQLSSASGMTIRLDGPVGLSFIPKLAVVARDISLSTSEGDISVTVPRLSTAITLSSLWADKLEIEAVTLTNPTISMKSPADTDSSQTAQEQAQADPFASIIDTLERLAVNRITIENGSLTSRDAAGSTSTITAIDADLTVPDLDREASFSLAATKDGRRAEISGTLSALRPILKRRPAQIAIEAHFEPASAPEFSSLSAAGEIQLNENGSYQIRGGRFDIGEQSFRLNALFQPGMRNHIFADLTAERIDVSALANAAQADASNDQAATATSAVEPDLLMLSGFDADISIAVDELVSGEMRASNVLFVATLHDGRFEAKLEHLGLKAGSVSATLSTDVRETPPTIQGDVVSSGLDIASMTKLFGQPAPVSGKLTVGAAFAFHGLTLQRMRNSANLRGTVGIREGTIPLAVLAGPDDVPADDITGLNLNADIHDITKPVDITGNLVWRGQTVDFKSRLAAHDFLSDKSGPISLSLTSKLLKVSVNGVAASRGTFKGQVSVATPSADKLMVWLGQTGSESLQDFSFKGAIDAGPGRFSFQKAALALNGIKASGQGSIKLRTPVTIRTSLKFAELDFAALAGDQHDTSDRKQTPGADADAPIDLSFLRELDAKIQIAADKIGYGKIFAGPLATTLTVADGKAHLIVPQSPFYEGTIPAELVANGARDLPSVRFEATVDGAAATPLLRDAADFDRIEGRLDTTIAVTGTGKTTKSLARSLSGSAAVKFSDGALRGIDIAEAYNNLVGLLSNGFKQDEKKKTAFTELGASFAIENGIAQTKDIKLLGPLVRMDGSGRVDLAEQTLEIHLNPQVIASRTGQGGDIAAKGIGVPVVVEGPLSGPRIYPDMSALLKNPKGALETLGRLGFPTKKLDLDRFIPGEQQNGSDGAGQGTADLIGDLIKGARDKLEHNDTGENTPSERGKTLDEAAMSKTRDVENAAKAIVSDLLKKQQSRSKPSPGEVDGTAASKDASGAFPPAPGNNPRSAVRLKTPAQPIPEPALVEPQAQQPPPATSRKMDIGSLLDKLVQ